MWDSGFRVRGLAFRGSGYRIYGVGFSVFMGFGYRIYGLGFRASSLGIRI